MRRGLSIALALCITLLPACGPDEPDEEDQSVLDRVKERVDRIKKRVQKSKERPCIDHEECLAKEHCSEGVCKPYDGRTIAEPRPDMGSNP